MSFGVVSGIGCIRLEGVHVPQGKGVVSGFFRFHNLGGMNRHFQAKRAKYSNVHIIETTEWIPTKFCILVKTSKYALCVFEKRENKSKMADGRIFGVRPLKPCPHFSDEQNLKFN